MSEALQQSEQNQLKQYIEAIERLMEDKAGVQSDIKDKFTEAKDAGFDTKIMKEVIKLRRKSRTEIQEFDTMLDVYMHAMGMVKEEDE